MARRVSLVVPLFVVLGCGPGRLGFDDETAQESESEDDATATTQPSTLEAESESTESSESESSESESSESESTDEGPIDDGEGFCGDGRIGRGEQCDGDNLDGFGCLELGYEGGTLTCYPDLCTFDASQCQAPGLTDCGNGVVEFDEDCEGDMTVSCLDHGFAGGSASCNAPCLLDGEPVPCPHGCKFDFSECLSEGEGTACMSGFDCPANVPICTNDACWNGGEGDPCIDVSDCMPFLGCTSAGECWDGSTADPCLIDADCDTGYCAFGHCYDGFWGSPCENTNDDCAVSFTFFCAGHYCTTL